MQIYDTRRRRTPSPGVSSAGYVPVGADAENRSNYVQQSGAANRGRVVQILLFTLLGVAVVALIATVIVLAVRDSNHHKKSSSGDNHQMMPEPQQVENVLVGFGMVEKTSVSTAEEIEMVFDCQAAKERMCDSTVENCLLTQELERSLCLNGEPLSEGNLAQCLCSGTEPINNLEESSLVDPAVGNLGDKFEYVEQLDDGTEGEVVDADEVDITEAFSFRRWIRRRKQQPWSCDRFLRKICRRGIDHCNTFDRFSDAFCDANGDSLYPDSQKANCVCSKVDAPEPPADVCHLCGNHPLEGKLLDHPDGAAKEPAYCLRLDNFADLGAGIVTFSCEQGGAQVNWQYDGQGTYSFSGQVYGGLDTGSSWDNPQLYDVSASFSGYECCRIYGFQSEDLCSKSLHGGLSIQLSNGQGPTYEFTPKANSKGDTSYIGLEHRGVDGISQWGWLMGPGASGTQDILGVLECQPSEKPCKTGTETSLIAGQSTNAGTVSIDQTSSGLSIEVQGDGYCLHDAHLYVGTSAPVKNAPGQFSPSNLPFSGPTDSWSIDVELVDGDGAYIVADNGLRFSPSEWIDSELSCNDKLFVIVHADVCPKKADGTCGSDSQGGCETAFAFGQPFESFKYKNQRWGWIVRPPYCCLGGCCSATGCQPETSEGDCLHLPGIYLGDETACEAGVCDASCCDQSGVKKCRLDSVCQSSGGMFCEPSVPDCSTADAIDERSCRQACIGDVVAEIESTLPVGQRPQIDEVITLTASATGGTSAYTFSWTGPNGFTATGPSITLQANLITALSDYTVTAADLLEFCGSDTETFTIRPVCTLQIETFPQYNDDYVYLEGGASSDAPPYTYQWTGCQQDPGSFGDFEVNPPFNIPCDVTLVVTDNDECVAETTVEIKCLSSLSVTDIQRDLLVKPDQNTPVTLSVGFSGGSNQVPSFQWFKENQNGVPEAIMGATGASLVINSGGVYSVQVNDPVSECGSATKEIVVCSLAVEIQETQSIEGGELTAVVTGALGLSTGLSYQWSGPDGFSSNGATIMEVQVLGTYTVQVTDAEGCTASDSFDFVPLGACCDKTPVGSNSVELQESECQDDVKEIDCGASGQTWNAFHTCVDVTCPECNLVVTTEKTDVQAFENTLSVNVLNAAQPITVEWFLGDAVMIGTPVPPEQVNEDNSLTATEEGVYYAVVTDANGCVKQSMGLSVNLCSITQPISVTISNDGPGELTAVPTPNSVRYFYSWSGPDSVVFSTQTITVSAPGEYTVEIVADGEPECEPATASVTLDSFCCEVDGGSSVVDPLGADRRKLLQALPPGGEIPTGVILEGDDPSPTSSNSYQCRLFVLGEEPSTCQASGCNGLSCVPTGACCTGDSCEDGQVVSQQEGSLVCNNQGVFFFNTLCSDLNPGTLSVTLEITYQSSTQAQIVPTVSGNNADLALDYAWTGPGTFTQGASGSIAGSLVDGETYSLTVTQGCGDTATASIQVNYPAAPPPPPMSPVTSCTPGTSCRKTIDIQEPQQPILCPADSDFGSFDSGKLSLEAFQTCNSQSQVNWNMILFVTCTYRSFDTFSGIEQFNFAVTTAGNTNGCLDCQNGGIDYFYEFAPSIFGPTAADTSQGFVTLNVNLQVTVQGTTITFARSDDLMNTVVFDFAQETQSCGACCDIVNGEPTCSSPVLETACQAPQTYTDNEVCPANPADLCPAVTAPPSPPPPAARKCCECVQEGGLIAYASTIEECAEACPRCLFPVFQSSMVPNAVGKSSVDTTLCNDVIDIVCETETIFPSPPPPFVCTLAVDVISFGNVVVTDAQEPVTYEWRKNPSFDVISSDPNFDTSVSGSYTLTVTDAAGCTDSDTIDVPLQDAFCERPLDVMYTAGGETTNGFGLEQFAPIICPKIGGEDAIPDLYSGKHISVSSVQRTALIFELKLRIRCDYNNVPIPPIPPLRLYEVTIQLPFDQTSKSDLCMGCGDSSTSSAIYFNSEQISQGFIVQYQRISCNSEFNLLGCAPVFGVSPVNVFVDVITQPFDTLKLKRTSAFEFVDIIFPQEPCGACCSVVDGSAVCTSPTLEIDCQPDAPDAALPRYTPGAICSEVACMLPPSSPPPPLVCDLTVNVETLRQDIDGSVDEIVFLLATAEGGIAPYQYNWVFTSLGSEVTASGASTQLTKKLSQRITYTLVTTDAQGCTITENYDEGACCGTEQTEKFSGTQILQSTCRNVFDFQCPQGRTFRPEEECQTEEFLPRFDIINPEPTIFCDCCPENYIFGVYAEVDFSIEAYGVCIPQETTLPSSFVQPGLTNQVFVIPTITVEQDSYGFLVSCGSEQLNLVRAGIVQPSFIFPSYQQVLVFGPNPTTIASNFCFEKLPEPSGEGNTAEEAINDFGIDPQNLNEICN